MIETQNFILAEINLLDFVHTPHALSTLHVDLFLHYGTEGYSLKQLYAAFSYQVILTI